MTLQESTIERLALKYERLAVRDGYLDGHADVTTPTGQNFRVDEDGVATRTGVNFSIRWSE